MYQKYLFLILLCLLFLNAYPQDQEKAILKTFHTISSHDLLNDAAELSSAKYEGRLSGSPGYQAAAQWVAERLKQTEVKPGQTMVPIFSIFRMHTKMCKIREA